MKVAARMADWGDRLPPVLIKEVRQALRGRAFVLPFVVSVLLACLLTWRWSLEQGTQPDGEALLAMLNGVLMLPAAFLVPFAAFQTMSAEWDEGTIEQLQLSTLSPLSLAAGKLLAALVQIALFVSAFAPFVTLSAIAGGVGLGHVLNTLTQVIVVAVALSSWALALGTFAKHRAARAVMFFLLLTAGLQVIRIPLAGLFGRGGMSAPTLEELVIRSVFFGLIPGVAGLAIAATRLAHPATNTSTPLRLTASVGCLIALLAATAHAWSSGSSQSGFGGAVALLMFLLSLCALFFTTEPEPLPRPVRARLVARGGEQPFQVFYLPGGGRGVAWFWLHGALLIGLASVFGVGLEPDYAGSDTGIDVVLPPLVIFLLANGYILLPAAVLSGWNTTAYRRAILRWIPVLLSLGFLVLAGALRLVTGSDMGLSSLLNPILLFQEAASRGVTSGHMFLVILIGLLGAVPSLGRVSLGLLEVRRTGREPAQTTE